MLDGTQVGTLGAVMQAGQRFEDPSQIDFLGLWEDVRKGAYDADAMLVENEEDGIWGSVLQPSQGLFWYRIPDSELFSEICRCYNDWIADFCKPHPRRLKGIAMLNVDDPEAGAKELERCRQDGPGRRVHPGGAAAGQAIQQPDLRQVLGDGAGSEAAAADAYRHPAQRRPGQRVHDGRDRIDRRGALDHRLLGTLFARLDAVRRRVRPVPGLKIGSVEHEASWIPHWLQQMDFTYVERPVFTKGWKSAEGLMPSDYWKRNMFVEFMEDDLGVQLRDRIGVENMLWGSDYPHAEATFPRSQQFLQRMFAGVPEDDLRKITSSNAAKMFGFELN